MTSPDDEEEESGSFADRAASARRRNNGGSESVSDADGYEAWSFPWSLSFNYSLNYAFDLKKIAYMNCSISRDLHCFTMTASFVPVGPYKSYNFHIAVKSSVLSDLKYDKRSSRSNGVTWY